MTPRSIRYFRRRKQMVMLYEYLYILERKLNKLASEPMYINKYPELPNEVVFITSTKH